MKICPWCEAGYPDELTTCPLHGGLLSEIRDFKPGMLIRNSYRIVRKLSKGGMGHVYLAQHILLNEPQVLKFLSPDLSRDKDWTSRFLREVRTLRLIRHKNVVLAGNLEPAEDGTLFFSMEYIEGPDLLEFYRRSPRPFDIALTLELVHGIAEGLGAAHAVGVVHRDIKPENILISVEGNKLVPKIADFGIVATGGDSRLTQSGNTLLTPQFAAPEQWLGTPTKDLDGRTDLYALGGLLYELLTGLGAFKADNYSDWAQQHIHTPAPRPSDSRPEVKEWRGLDDLVLSLLAKDPADRPANVEEVLRRIEAIAPPKPHLEEPAEPAQTFILKENVVNPRPAADPPSKTSEPVAAASMSDAPASPDVPQAKHRARLISEPLVVWKPVQPRGVDPSHHVARPRQAKSTPSNRILLWIAAAAVLIVLGFAARRFMVSPVQFRELKDQQDAIFAVSFAPNGLGLVSASHDNTVQFWNVPDGRPLGTIAGATTSLAFSPDGHALATGMGDYSINIWDAAHATVLGTLVGHTGNVAAVAFSPDGHTLASASWDKTVRLWDVASGQSLRTLNGHTDRVLTLAYSPGGHLLASAGTDQTIRLWDPARGMLLQTLKGHTRAINSIVISPDGRILASASDDLTIKLWNIASGQPVHVLEGHTGPVLTLAFSPDGRTLVSGSTDTTVRLWDASTGRSLRVLKGHTGPVLSVAFSPFGYTVASGSADKTIRLWEVASVRE